MPKVIPDEVVTKQDRRSRRKRNRRKMAVHAHGLKRHAGRTIDKKH